MAPIWLMRQAGRYLPEYRKIREQHQMLEMINLPEVATEVTLQPIRRFNLDAAIIFSDILPLLDLMGLDLSFIPGVGPVLGKPIQSPGDVEKLKRVPAAEGMAPTLEAIRMTRRELDGKVPLIGFSGAPFTLACYAIQGGGSKEFHSTKEFMYEQPAAWESLMTQLTESITEYLIAQAEAGAQALQLFDSWAGILSPGDFRQRVLPYVQQIVQQVKAATDVPFIYFGTGTSGMLPLLSESGGDVIGADWRIDIGEARRQLGSGFAVQGNLDPVKLLGPEAPLLEAAREILDSAGTDPGYIFNLGHGVIKETDPERVAALVDFVHTYSAQQRAQTATP